eukprot:762047-Pelagomonas_calceolata.AAC.4
MRRREHARYKAELHIILPHHAHFLSSPFTLITYWRGNMCCSRSNQKSCPTTKIKIAAGHYLTASRSENESVMYRHARTLFQALLDV